MMCELDIAKKKLELNKVKCAREEMELKILERSIEIKRLKESVKAQDNRISEIETELQGV